MGKKLKAVVGGMLIDGTGAEPVKDSVVLVEADRIKELGSRCGISVPDDAEIIHAGGKTVMPGIIEGHAHINGSLSDQKILRLSLQRGITTIYSVSANIPGIALSAAIEDGSVRGCSRLIPGGIVTCTNGHVKGRFADGPWEVRKAVREMAEAGSAFIKTAASGGFYGKNETCNSPNYTLEELIALTEEAHAWGLPVVVHCHTQPGLNNCIEAGVNQIHHGAFIDESAVKGILDKGLYYVPTLAVTCQRNIDALADQPWQAFEMKAAQPIHRAGVRLAHSLGVNLALGTDYPGTPATWRIGDRTLYELAELVQCGLSPMEAIVAGTRNTAEAYGNLNNFGTLEKEKKADLIILDGNPLTDINIIYDSGNINLVMKDGIVECSDEDYKKHYDVKERLQDKEHE